MPQRCPRLDGDGPDLDLAILDGVSQEVELLAHHGTIADSKLVTLSAVTSEATHVPSNGSPHEPQVPDIELSGVGLGQGNMELELSEGNNES